MHRYAHVFALLVVLIARSATAAPFTPHFDALRAELEARVAAGTLEPKQERAATKALAALEAASSSLAADIRIAGKVLKRLAKPFADELASGAGLGTLSEGLKAALLADVEAELAALDATASGLEDGACLGRVDAAVRRATGRLAAANAANPAAILTRLIRTLAKGAAKAEKCTPASSVTTTTTSVTSTTSSAGTTTTTVGTTCDANTLTISVDDAPFVPETAYFHRGDDVQSVVVAGSANAPAFSELSLVAWTVDGPGTFAVQEFSSWVEAGDVTFQPPSPYTVTGTLTITKLVAGAGGCVAGSFDVTFTAPGRVRHLTGSFDLNDAF